MKNRNTKPFYGITIGWLTHGIAFGTALLLGVAGSQVNAQLTNYTFLHSFGSRDLQGFSPDALTLGRDGALYGTTQSGGDGAGFGGLGAPVIFKMNPDGSGYVVLYRLAKESYGSSHSKSSLILNSDNWLYGLHRFGSDGSTFAFRISTNGVGFTILHTLTNAEGTVSWNHDVPPLLDGGDEKLYACADSGGASGLGTLFRFGKDGTGFTLLHTFSGVDGSTPWGGLLQISGGQLCGVTSSGGSNGLGTLFTMDKDGNGYQVRYHFAGGTNGVATPFKITLGSDGALYGLASGDGTNGGAIFKIGPDGSGVAALHRFGPGTESPLGIIEGTDGLLYGVSTASLFKLNRDGSGFAVAHTFSDSPDGSDPMESIVGTPGGVIVGLTMNGGTEAGTAFSMREGGAGYRVIRNFSFTGGDGWPENLVAARDGYLYGCTDLGGTNDLGTFYRVKWDGSGFAVLQHFGDFAAQGCGPCALIQGSDGAFYGAAGGYIGTNFHRQDAVFRLTPAGTCAVLHQFTNWVDGAYVNGLLEASDGMLYGTTIGGGQGNGGIVFRLNKDGSDFGVIHEFDTGSLHNVAFPRAPLIEGSDGALYGTASGVEPLGGSFFLYAGGVFKLNKDGSGYTVLHTFYLDIQYGPPGPDTSVVEAGDGMLYGTWEGWGLGTIYTLGRDGSGYSVITNGASGALSKRHDGTICGCARGPASNFVFKLNSAGYDVLWSGPCDAGPQILLEAPDRALYGLAPGGAANAGAIFRFGHALNLTRSAATSQIGICGIPGDFYELQRSVDFRNWHVVTNFVMPTSPWVSVQDRSVSANAAFYRLRVP